MKKTIISGSVFLLMTAFAHAQAPIGLDSIIVEKYYISDLNDTSSNSLGGGVLPVNSVTYRIYADLKPGFKFQAAYGLDLAPAGSVNPGDHELRMQTSTMFFNNEDNGDITPSYSKVQAKGNSTMLDSWLSVGAACSNNFGVLKSEDDGVANIVNADGILQNTSPEAGIPLTTQDGILLGTPMAVTQVGITTETGILNDLTNGSLFSTYNGSWAALGGSAAPGVDNKVLIAQITTDGVFSFTLNIQLGTPTPGGVENWVASNPSGSEGTHPTLTYIDSLHSVSIASAKNKANATLFTVYPNPAHDLITIDVNQVGKSSDNSYTIYSIDGKLVASKKLGSLQGRTQEKVDISNFQPGLYFIEVSVDGAKSTKKIVKY